MPTIKTFTPTIAEGDELTKTQVWHSLRNKRIVQSAIGDDGVHTFVIATTYQRLADFIRANDIQSYDTTKFQLFIEFVRNGTDPRAARDAAVKHDAGATQSVQRPDAPASRKSSGTDEGGKGRSRKQTSKK